MATIQRGRSSILDIPEEYFGDFYDCFDHEGILDELEGLVNELLPKGVYIASNGDIFAEEGAEDPDWEWIEYVVTEQLPEILESYNLGGYPDSEEDAD